jgi:hypothetical protein
MTPTCGSTLTPPEGFESATDAQIRALAECGWGGDYPADEVAGAMRTIREVDALFVLVELRGAGYECYVEPGGALAWVAEHRPHLQPPGPCVRTVRSSVSRPMTFRP